MLQVKLSSGHQTCQREQCPYLEQEVCIVLFACQMLMVHPLQIMMVYIDYVEWRYHLCYESILFQTKSLHQSHYYLILQL